MKRFLVLAVLCLAVATAARAAAPWPTGCIQPIVAGQTISGTLVMSDCSYYFDGAPSNLYYTDVYSFSGTAGQQIAIAMNSSAVDAWLDLYIVNDVTADALVYDDDGGGGTNARIPSAAATTRCRRPGRFTSGPTPASRTRPAHIRSR